MSKAFALQHNFRFSTTTTAPSLKLSSCPATVALIISLAKDTVTRTHIAHADGAAWYDTRNRHRRTVTPNCIEKVRRVRRAKPQRIERTIEPATERLVV